MLARVRKDFATCRRRRIVCVPEGHTVVLLNCASSDSHVRLCILAAVKKKQRMLWVFSQKPLYTPPWFAPANICSASV